MSGRDPSRGPDPDDWFTPPDGAQPRGSGMPSGFAAGREATAEERAQHAAPDDWLDDEAAAEGDLRGGRKPIERRRIAVAAGAAAIVLLVVGLAVGGVFSGDKQPAAATTAPAPTTTQTPSTPVTQPTAAPPPAPATALKPGDQGAQVKRLQHALAKLGYATGAVDGDYGPSTQSALTRFQKASGLPADGVLGPKTLAALKQALLTAL
jgi:hypothetical protein